MRRRFFFGIAAVISAAAACFPSFSGLDDGNGGAIPFEDADTPPPGDDGPIGPVVDDDGSAFDVVVPDGGDATLPYALSCADAKKRGAMFDGVVTIDPDGLGPVKPFDVFCKDVATPTPKEYLTLVNQTDPTSGSAETSGSNVSCFAMGMASTFTCSCPPDDVRAFQRVRLDVSKSPLRIVTSDTTYSTTNRPGNMPSSCEMTQGTSKCDAFGHPQSNFGAGSSCVETPQTVEGRANVDLRGTPFHIDPGEKGHLEGYMPFGTITYVNDSVGLRKQAEVHGGGRCGLALVGNATDTLTLEQDP